MVGRFRPHTRARRLRSPVRFILLILDGDALGPDPLDALERASTPHLDRLAAGGRVGAFVPAAPTFAGGLLTLLGGDPACGAFASTSLLRASALGVDPGPGGWVLRASLVSVSEDDRGPMHAPIEPSPEERRVLFADLLAHWREAIPEAARGLEFCEDGSGWLVVDRSGASFAGTELVDPALCEGSAWVEHLPDGGGPGSGERLCALISASRFFLADHPVNAARIEHAMPPANLAWFWDAGHAGAIRGALGPDAPARGARLFADAPSAVGLARLLDLETEPVGDFDSLARRMLGADASIVAGVLSTGVEEADGRLIGPLVETLGGTEDREAPWRVLVALTHAGGNPAPFALAGGWVRGLVPRRLHEGPWSDLIVDPGRELLEYTLRGGLRGVR
jgi:hypothetical protein